MTENDNTNLIIEITRKKHTELSNTEIIELTSTYISTLENIPPTGMIKCESISFLDINQHVELITILGVFKIPIDSTTKFYVYTINERAPEVETIEIGEEEIATSNHWILPSSDFQGLYENLIYDNNLKENLLKYVETTMLFSDKCIDPNIIACNRLVLLHGPPGTGKTSLCKALAQKISIRMNSRYTYTHLIEINSHSLFSKWFSESGKLVMKLFAQIKEIIEHKKSLVCVLIDEVESIAFCRQSVGSNEPSDSLRVVNSVLTQLDQIRHYPNVLIFTTSNLTSAIDSAFLDRADIKQYIGYPSVEARYEIFFSAIHELKRAQIITKGEILPYRECIQEHLLRTPSINLLKICQMSVGLSGRILRKIPFSAHALYLKSPTASVDQYLVAMSEALKMYLNERYGQEPNKLKNKKAYKPNNTNN